MNPFYKNLALWLVITLMMIMLYNLFNQQKMGETSISYTEFLSMVDEERVGEVTIQGQELFVTDANGSRFKVFAPADPDLTLIVDRWPGLPDATRSAILAIVRSVDGH